MNVNILANASHRKAWEKVTGQEIWAYMGPLSATKER